MLHPVFATMILLVSASAWAESRGSKGAELIVRFEEPQNHPAQIRANLQNKALKTRPEIRIVDSSEGLVKLSFASNEEAAEARAALQDSSDIVSVAPNLLYRPAIHYGFKPAEDKDALSPLDRLAAFAAAIPDVLLPPSRVIAGADPLMGRDWAWKSVGMDRVSRVATSSRLRASRSMITAVIDTGVDYNHEDLIGGMWRKGGTPTEVGYDFAHDVAKPYDKVHFDIQGCMNNRGCQLGINADKFLVNPGHGTHCAGHVAAVANNSLGIRGMGAGSQIMALKFFYDVGELNAGQGDDAAAISSIMYAVRNGAKIISASWGGRVPRAEAATSELRVALEVARDAGVLFIVAAGNDAVNQDTVANPAYPAAYGYDNMIVVAASDKSDQLARFSSYGPRSVHIAAPGVKIFSTTAAGGPNGTVYDDVVANFTDSEGAAQSMDWDGTSMATPIVAGAAAMIWSKYPTENYKQIRDRILNSARRVPSLRGKVSTGGVLDVAAALAL